MTEDDIKKLLGRSLSTVESDNFSLYLDIAIERLSDLFCIGEFTTEKDSGGDPIETTNVYSGRVGYSILYIDPFTSLNKVEVDGEEKTVTKQQWDKRNADWYNAIVFEDSDEMEKDGKPLDVSVTAGFGYGDPLPVELRLLLARAFDLITLEKNANPRIKSKRNEDYSITYGSITSEWESFKTQNKTTIQKYSQCGLGQIQHGDTDKEPYRYGGGGFEE